MHRLSKVFLASLATAVLAQDQQCQAIRDAMRVLESSACGHVVCEGVPTGPTEVAPGPVVTTPTTTTSTTPTTTSTTTSKVEVPSTSSFLRSVVYIDWKMGGWQASHLQSAIMKAIDNGFTHVVLGFWMHLKVDEPGVYDRYMDAALIFAEQMTPEERQATLDYAHARGAHIFLAVGGATEYHGTFAEGLISGTEYGTKAAAAVVAGGFDGVDVDSENWSSVHFSSGKALTWLADVTNALHAGIQGREICHAPQAPYFSADFGGKFSYKELHAAVGDKIAYYFIQFYNQGSSYGTYQTEFVESGQWFFKTSIKEMIADGIPASKLAYGKFVKGNGSTGYVSPAQFRENICKAYNELGWNGGAGIWQYDNDSLEETLAFGNAVKTPC